MNPKSEMARKKEAATPPKRHFDWEKIERAADAVEGWPAFMKGEPWQPSGEQPETDKPRAKAKSVGK